MTAPGPDGYALPVNLREALPLSCNVDDDTLYRHVASAVQRRLPLLQVAEPHDGHAVIVGGGPSLAEQLDEIEWRKSRGQHIYALNGAGQYLQSRGITPNALIILDAREHNRRFLAGLFPTTTLYLASQCHPGVFDDADAMPNQTIMWHPNLDGRSGVIEDRETILIGGGTSVGMRALSMVGVLGYRQIHLYGLDSSYRDGEGHAYSQAENASDQRIEILCGDKRFSTVSWMARQAQDFIAIAGSMADENDAIITVHGDGLLPHVARLMMEPPAEDAAVYDLTYAPAQWDFAQWLIIAEMDRLRRKAPGPLRVCFLPGPKDGFRDDGLPLSPPERQNMLDNVIRPMLPMLGAVEDRSAWNGYRHHYLFKAVCRSARMGETVPRFKPPEWAVGAVIGAWMHMGITKPPVTITLREAGHWEHRNSDIDAWLAFAQRLKAEGEQVVFVRDHAHWDEPIPGFPVFAKAAMDTQLRCALYEMSRANLFVANGPAALALFGTKPWLMFKPLIRDWPAGSTNWWVNNVGVTPGGQFPWSAPYQRIVWKPDTLDDIDAAWRALKPHLPQEAPPEPAPLAGFSFLEQACQ